MPCRRDSLRPEKHLSAGAQSCLGKSSHKKQEMLASDTVQKEARRLCRREECVCVVHVVG